MTAMRVRVGTSGYSYAPWKGSFYPKDIKADGMLRYYAERFPTVEINNTFYRMPTESMLKRWADETPDAFSFVLKAPRRITHERRLADPESVLRFLDASAVLASKRGPLLFQLPPFFKKDMPRLREFLGQLPPGSRAAFEFRHASWNDAEVADALRDAGASLCLADTDEAPATELTATADWGYLRLRRAEYDEPALGAWADRILAQPWSEAWVFFKHEDEGKGPALGSALVAALAARGA